jgi:hypothetical protein
MADLFLTKTQLEDLFWRMTMIALGYNPDDYVDIPADPDDPESEPITVDPVTMPVRLAWLTAGTPAWGITEDVTFIHIGEADHDINKQIDVSYNQNSEDVSLADQSSSQTRVLNISWIFYGPNSFDNAFMFKRKLFDPSIRGITSPYLINLVPNVTAPQRRPEMFSGQWWERTDLLNVQFNELVKFTTAVPYIQSSAITIKTESGDDRDVNVEPE